MADETEHTVRPFADWLREQRKGATHDELSDALNALVSAVHKRGKGGSLVFTVKVEPVKDNPDVVMVNDTIVVKAPQKKRPASVFFPGKDGNLYRDDPRQMQFEGLQVVESDREPDVKERASGDTE